MRLTSMALAVSILAATSSAFGQQASTGLVTTIDRVSGTIAIQPTPSGTVGAATGGATEQFKVQGNMLERLHVGDSVTYSTSEANGTKTISTIAKK